MYYFMITLHVLVCIIMIMAVMLQPGKGNDMGSAFGGGGNALFGGRGPVTFLSKVTWIGVVIFMITSILLSIESKRRTYGSSVIDFSETETSAPAKKTAEKKPVPPAETTENSTPADGTKQP